MTVKDIFPCPFCDSMGIDVIFVPKRGEMIKESYSSVRVESAPQGEVMVDGCPNCGKSRKEIKKEMKKRGWLQ